RELSAGIGLGRGLEQAAIRKDDLEARDRVADTPAPETSEPGAPGIDRAADRAPRRIERDRREGKSFRLYEVLDLFPGRARFDRDRPGIGVEREDIVHLAHVDEDTTTVRDGASAPARPASPRCDLEQALVAQFNESRDLLRRLRQGDEIRIETPLQERDFGEGGEV